MATLSLMVHHEVQNYEDHKVSFKKDPKPYVLPQPVQQSMWLSIKRLVLTYKLLVIY